MTNEKYLDEVLMLNEMAIKAELLLYIFPRPDEIVYGDRVSACGHNEF